MSKLPAQAAVTYAHKRGWIDVPGGLALMRDRNVPLAQKVSALGLGFVIMLVLGALELPLETAVEFMTAGLATPLFAVFDGLEFILLPILLGAAILSRRARRA